MTKTRTGFLIEKEFSGTTRSEGVALYVKFHPRTLTGTRRDALQKFYEADTALPLNPKMRHVSKLLYMRKRTGSSAVMPKTPAPSAVFL